MPRKHTRDQIIQRCIDVHGNKFDYTKVVYVNVNTKITVICPKHGEFEITPSSHIHNKSQCAKCANDQKSIDMTSTTSDFITHATRIHKGLYDYSLVDYQSAGELVMIVCNKHGPFTQTPTNHIHSTAGCPRCVGKSKTLEMFVEEARNIHGNLYDYSKVEYSLSTTPVAIICSEHGTFMQTPTGHISGRGCSKCWGSKGERRISNQLKRMGIVFEEQKRFATCRNVRPLPFDFWLPECNTLIEYDGEIHDTFVKHIHKTAANFIRTQHHDSIKTTWASNNDIKLIRIHYTSLPNIEAILIKLFPTSNE